MRLPVNDAKISSPYGWRKLNGTRQFHDGIDFISTTDDERVFAIADGVVIHDMDTYSHKLRMTDTKHSAGNYIILRHLLFGQNYYVRYLHLVSNLFNRGNNVFEGDVLGNYGNVGFSFGAHTHLDIYALDWRKLNPTPIFKEIQEKLNAT